MSNNQEKIITPAEAFFLQEHEIIGDNKNMAAAILLLAKDMETEGALVQEPTPKDELLQIWRDLGIINDRISKLAEEFEYGQE